MNKGIKVRTIFDGKEGVSCGPVHTHSIWWILVEWFDGTKSIVMEQCLEVVNEKG